MKKHLNQSKLPILILLIGLLMAGCKKDLEKIKIDALQGDKKSIDSLYWNDFDVKKGITKRPYWVKIGYLKTNDEVLNSRVIPEYMTITKDYTNVNIALNELNKLNPKNEKLAAIYFKLKHWEDSLNVPELEKYKICFEQKEVPPICREQTSTPIKGYKEIKVIEMMAQKLPDAIESKIDNQ